MGGPDRRSRPGDGRLDAPGGVIVRRVERGIGVAIRAGQDDGKILKQGEVKRRVQAPDIQEHDICTVSEATGLTYTLVANELYPLADGVSADEFETAPPAQAQAV